MIGWSAMKQKVRTSQVSWMTFTQRTICRPLAQVWVVTGLRKLFDILFSTADCRLYVGDSAQGSMRPFTYPRHWHAYRDQPATTGGCASGTDSAMSPMDKVRVDASRTLHRKCSAVFLCLRANRVAGVAGFDEVTGDA